MPGPRPVRGRPAAGTDTGPLGRVPGVQSMAAVQEIWRYPVKSMGGQRVAASAADGRGLLGDRVWAVIDADRKHDGEEACGQRERKDDQHGKSHLLPREEQREREQHQHMRGRRQWIGPSARSRWR